jgi:uncharacterized protein (TIGR03382 family)
MRKVIVACALLVCPLAARAQNFVLTSPQAAQVNATSAPQIFVGAKNCATEVLQFHWDLTNIGGLGNGQVLNIVKARSSSTCNGSTTVTAPDIISAAPSQTVTGEDSVTAQAMILDPDGGLPGGCNNTTTSSATPWSTFYCVQVSNGVVGGSTIFEDIQINYATAPPTAPTQLSVQPGDQHLKVFWEPGNAAENIATYDVHVLPLDAGTLNLTTPALNNVSNQTTADVTRTDDNVPLQDDQTYNVLVVANDRYGNQSEPSGAVPGTPVHVLDFYGLYRQEGGRASGGGGCSSAGAGVWVALLALLVGLAVRRHKKLRNGGAGFARDGRSARARSIGGAALIALFALFAPKAQAQVFPTTQGYQRPPRFLLVAVKADRYDPKIDSEPGLTGSPYHQIFGGRIPLRWQLEVDWEFWHPFGSFMIGGTVGYWQNIGKGLVAATGAQSQDTALLDVIPLGAVLTYRFDVLADMWPRFPVIPYGQIGVTRALWASFNGVGNVSSGGAAGGRGSGWTWGYTTALGLALALDSLDPDLSREAYLDTGIQRTSIFAEYGWTRLDGFHNNSSLILSDRAWRFGLAMEF